MFDIRESLRATVYERVSDVAEPDAQPDVPELWHPRPPRGRHWLWPFVLAVVVAITLVFGMAAMCGVAVYSGLNSLSACKGAHDSVGDLRNAPEQKLLYPGAEKIDSDTVSCKNGFLGGRQDPATVMDFFEAQGSSSDVLVWYASTLESIGWRLDTRGGPLPSDIREWTHPGPNGLRRIRVQAFVPPGALYWKTKERPLNPAARTTILVTLIGAVIPHPTATP